MADWESSAELWIVRHGATAWSESGRHTSHTEVPLEPSGEKQARALGGRLQEFDFASVLSSPRLRAVHTAPIPVGNITASTLVLVGESDPLATRPDVLATAIPTARCQTVPGDHLSCLRDPAYAPAVVGFFALAETAL